MILFYTVLDALVFLKKEMDGLEARLKASKNRLERSELESLLEWRLERGLMIIEYARPSEVSQDLVDYFLNRIQRKPEYKKRLRLWNRKIKKKL